jgi:large conductance mechanosensitive channel
MSVLKEFRDFAMKWNVVDLAVGVIIGAAFGKIVSSLVEDIIMPPIGWLIGNVSFTDLKFALPALIEWQKAVTINYGNFLQIMFNFIIVAFCIFMMVKIMNKAVPKKKEEPKPTGPTDIELLTEIRDLLKK